ncbi:MAG: hypothetical protein R2762_12830 [Bryobacteraceae bacterium]
MPDRSTYIAAAVSIAAVTGALVYFHSRSELLQYGDAEAHLSIARRLTDSRTPGYEQIGTVWLPLPHWIMALPAQWDRAWQSGLAGAIPAAICHVAAALFLFAAARRIFDSSPAAWAALGLFLLNPNSLYLGVIPMTEPFFAAAFGALLWSTAAGRPVIAGIAACAATLIRYEGWFLLPFFSLAFLVRNGIRPAALFAAIAATGPVYWLAHNRWLDLDPLLFYRGPYSAKAIQGRDPYPGLHDWPQAWLYFRTAAVLIAGRPLAWLGACGALVCIARRQSIVALSALPALFYVISLHSAGTPIYVPTLWPNTYYNARYGFAAMPLLVLGAAALAAILPRRLQTFAAAAVLLGCMAAWIGSAPEQWIALKEPQVNSAPRREYTLHAAAFLRDHYRSGGILTGFGDLAGIFRESGIPLREAIHEGNGIDWLAQTLRPERFLRAEWVLARAGDPVDRAIVSLRDSAHNGPRYRLVKSIQAPRAPEIRIYRREGSAMRPPESPYNR